MYTYIYIYIRIHTCIGGRRAAGAAASRALAGRRRPRARGLYYVNMYIIISILYNVMLHVGIVYTNMHVYVSLYIYIYIHVLYMFVYS